MRNIKRALNSGGAAYLVLLGAVILAAPGKTAVAAAVELRAIDSTTVQSSAERFKSYVLQQIAQSLRAATNMRDRVAAHDLAGAQQAWLAARGGWEGSEVITNEYLPDLDRKIDAWPDADKGFHAIEARLFGAHDVAVLPAADELVSNLKDFEQQLRATTLTAQGVLNGSAKLAFEIGEDKAGGGESPFSGNSLAEIRDNVASIGAAYERVFAASTKKRNADLAKTFNADLREIQALLSVQQLKDLDQMQLRHLSESLTRDLTLVAHETGLAKPQLGN